VPAPDLEADVVLGPMTEAAQARPPGTSAGSDPGCVLLTGATGFVGAFLLRELLDRTRADVHCVVRASSAEHAAQRIRGAMEQYRLWDPALSARIVALPGDLGEHALGLADEQFERLAERVEVIYHNGAHVNHVQPYQRLRAVNVLGTREMLRLAATTRIKPLHYVSTAGAALSHEHNPEVVLESRQLKAGQVIPNGYIESKWVSEQLVRLAAEHRIPTAIYRPSHIVGHAGTGVCGINDSLWICVAAALIIGATPDGELGSEDIVPVDYVTRALVSISLRQEHPGMTYHLTNPVPTAIAKIFGRLRPVGHQVESLNYQDWRRRLGSAARSAGRAMPVLAAAMLMMDKTPPDSSPVLFDQSNARRELDGTGIACPVIGAELIDSYLRYLSESGFFPHL
jgi:thioester reductase-like protein